MRISDLKPNQRNPRRMSAKNLALLRASVKKFGDLSGFVYNRRSKMLIGGHQKQKVIPPDSPIQIEHEYDQPTASMTVAEGYVLIDGERFKYREVDADLEWEMEAIIAANKHSGEWDRDILKLASADFKNLNWEITGFEIPELKAMGISPPVFSDNICEPVSIPHEQSDEDYVKNTSESLEEIPIESFGSGPDLNNYEVLDPQDKQFVITIICPNHRVQQDLKEKLRLSVESVGANFF